MSGSESNSRKAKGRAHGLVGPPILPQQLLAEHRGSDGRMHVEKMQIMVLHMHRVSGKRMPSVAIKTLVPSSYS